MRLRECFYEDHVPRYREFSNFMHIVTRFKERTKSSGLSLLKNVSPLYRTLLLAPILPTTRPTGKLLST